MDNSQDTLSANATSNDIKTNDIAPTTLSVPVEESQGSSDWASTTLDALGPATDIPYPADGINNTDTAVELNSLEKVNSIQSRRFTGAPRTDFCQPAGLDSGEHHHRLRKPRSSRSVYRYHRGRGARRAIDSPPGRTVRARHGNGDTRPRRPIREGYHSRRARKGAGLCLEDRGSSGRVPPAERRSLFS